MNELKYLKALLLDIVEEIDNLPRTDTLDSARRIGQTLREISSITREIQAVIDDLNEVKE